MITRTISYLFSYSEKAFTPKIYTTLINTSLPTQNPHEIIHQLSLFELGISPFDYDYYHSSGFWLISHQKKLSLSDILLVLRLGKRHNIRNSLIWSHFQAQIHHRLHRQMVPLFQKEVKDDELLMGQIMEKLEEQSEDYFQLLRQQKKEQDENEYKVDEQKPNMKQQEKEGQKMMKLSKEISENMDEIAQLLIWFGCEDTDLLKLALETQLHPSIKFNNASSIRIAQMLAYTCQVHLNTYQNHKNRFTARSVKKIYKYQADYLPPLFTRISQSIPHLSDQQISYLAKVFTAFPIKKRQHKRKLVNQLTAEWTKRKLNLQQKQDTIKQLIGNDKKLMQKWTNAKNDHTSLLL